MRRATLYAVMKLISVNVGLPREIAGMRGEPVLTGIFKSPAKGRVRAGRLGLEGDAQADLRHHGGEDKAIYVYPHEHYARWAQATGREDFTPGQFGENLTTLGLLERGVRIGDRFRIGGEDGPLVEVTQPRVPCFKLCLRMGDAEFVKMFHESGGRVGFYLRVLEPGEIGTGDEIERVHFADDAPTIAEIYQLLYFGSGDAAWADAARQAASTLALSEAWRREFQKRLPQLSNSK